MKFEALLLEELNAYQAKLSKEQFESKRLEHSYKPHDVLFGEHNDHAVFPLRKSGVSNLIDLNTDSDVGAKNNHIFSAVAKSNHEVVDFDGNVARKRFVGADGKEKYRMTTISNILAKHPDNTLLQHYNNYRQLQNHDDHEIVFTRDPKHISGMSTGRRWDNTSCLRMPESAESVGDSGLFHHKLADEHRHGTIAAYLVKKGDHGIRNPIARIAVKRFVPTNILGNPHELDSEKGFHSSVWRPELRNSYGAKSTDFEETVKHIVKAHYPASKGKNYVKHPDLYDDDQEHNKIVNLAHDRPSNTGVKILKNEHGDLHSEDGKPSYVHDTGFERREKTHFNGHLHSFNGKPSHTHTRNNVIQTEEWHQHGHLHREGAPASVFYYPHTNEDGTPRVQSEEYSRFGMTHRLPHEGAAKIRYNTNGEAVFKHYVVHGVVHRPVEEGAAYIDHDTKVYSWMQFGKKTSPHEFHPSQINGSQYSPTVDFHHEKVGELKYNQHANRFAHIDANGRMLKVSMADKKITDFGSDTEDGDMTPRPMTEHEHSYYSKYKSIADEHLKGVKDGTKVPT